MLCMNTFCFLLFIQIETINVGVKIFSYCFSYIVVTIYCLGFIYSLPRFFEYKTEVQSEKLTVTENFTEYIDHILITNKALENRLYQYIVHLSKKIFNIYILKSLFLFLF
jgi:hypothetical protein